MTRRGIEYNLKVSPYRITTESGLTFVFSSKLHMNKFIAKQAAHREKINNSLSNRFNIYLQFDILADCTLYRQVENRGFLIIKDGVNYQWENSIRLDGETMTNRSLQD